MNDNKKGPAAANDQAPDLHDKHRSNFISRGVIALMQAAVKIAVFCALAMSFLVVVDRLWCGR